MNVALLVLDLTAVSPAPGVVYPGVEPRLVRWRERGGRVALVANMPGVGNGKVSVVQADHDLNEAARLTGHQFDWAGVCPHDPGSTDPLLARCWCHLPKAGLPLRAVHELGVRLRERYPAHLGLVVSEANYLPVLADALGMDGVRGSAWRAGAITDQAESLVDSIVHGS